MLRPPQGSERKVPSNSVHRLSYVCLCRHGTAREYQAFLNTEKWLQKQAIYLKLLMQMKVYFEWLKKLREFSENLEIIQGLIGRQ